MYSCLLSVGHGGPEGKVDPGAVANGFTEHDVAKKAVADAAEKLKAYGAQVTVETILDGKNLIQKIAYINKHKYDLAIEFHLDAGPSSATGTTTFFYGGSSDSEKKGNVIHNALLPIIGLKSRGVKPDTSDRWGRLGFVRDTNCFAFLVELGFITNANDLKVVQSKSAEGIAACVINYFNLSTPHTMDNNAPFTDVPATHPFHDAAQWAKDNGIAKGYPDGHLGVDETLTVGRFLEFLRKYDAKK